VAVSAAVAAPAVIAATESAAAVTASAAAMALVTASGTASANTALDMESATAAAFSIDPDFTAAAVAADISRRRRMKWCRPEWPD